MALSVAYSSLLFLSPLYKSLSGQGEGGFSISPGKEPSATPALLPACRLWRKEKEGRRAPAPATCCVPACRRLCHLPHSMPLGQEGEGHHSLLLSQEKAGEGGSASGPHLSLFSLVSSLPLTVCLTCLPLGGGMPLLPGGCYNYIPPLEEEKYYGRRVHLQSRPYQHGCMALLNSGIAWREDLCANARLYAVAYSATL